MQSKVKATPNDAQAHLQLASALLSAGDRQASIVEINTAITLQPDFKLQGEEFIRDILAGKTPQ
jgi:protein involved in temperature-dependent protein secretion